MKQLFFALLVLLFLVSFFSCQEEESLHSLRQDLPLLAAAEQPDTCIYTGDPRRFELAYDAVEEPSNIGLPSSSRYKVYFGGEFPFRLAEGCECYVKEMEMAFDYLPPDSQIKVWDENLVELSFIGPYDNQGNSSIKVDVSYISPTLYVGFLGQPDPEPYLIQAGGFCIIDNVSGPKYDPQDTLISPFVLESWNADNNKVDFTIILPEIALNAIP